MNATLDDLVDLKTIIEAQNTENAEVKAQLVAAAKCAHTALKAREKNFDNELVILLASIDGATGIRAVDANFQEKMRRLWEAMELFIRTANLGDDNFVTHCRNELREFATRNLDTTADYMDERAEDYPFLLKVRNRLRAVTLTEAAVERSFGMQKRFQTKARNRMMHSTAKLWLSLAMNMKHVKASATEAPGPTLPTKRAEDVTRAQCAEIMSSLLQVAPPATAPRETRNRRARDASHALEKSKVVVIGLVDDADPKRRVIYHEAILRDRFYGEATQGHECWQVRWLEYEEGQSPFGTFYPYGGPEGADEWYLLHEWEEKKLKTDKKKKK